MDISTLVNIDIIILVLQGFSKNKSNNKTGNITEKGLKPEDKLFVYLTLEPGILFLYIRI